MSEKSPGERTVYVVKLLKHSWDQPIDLCECESVEIATAMVKATLSSGDKGIRAILVCPELRF
jgi:hypothetical protein